MRNRYITARIPLQSKIGSEEPIFASFSPGEAMGAPAPEECYQFSLMWFCSRALRMALERMGATTMATAMLKVVAGSLAAVGPS